MPVNKPYFIDIYAGDTVQGANDEGFALVKAAGIVFLDHKASQGTDFVDKMCAFRRLKWMTGIAVAVIDVDGTVLSLLPRFSFYHFNGTASAPAEAAHFIASVKAAGFQPGDDLELDWEDIGASGYQRDATYADDFCDAVEQWSGFPIKVYGGDAPRQQLVHATSAQLDRFAKRRYWDCQYGMFRPELVPVPWKGKDDGVFEWQDDGDQWGPGPHRVAGLAGYCDNSTVVGAMTVAKAYAAWGGGIMTTA
jgi:hypothetical protein